jgi:hypothetical protein
MRIGVALVVSLVLHALLLLWLRTRPEVAAVVAPPLASNAIEIEVHQVTRRVSPSSPPVAAPRPAAIRMTPAPAPVPATDPPRQVTLLPRPDAIALPEPEAARGHTVHNVPEEILDGGALLAMQERQGRARVDGFLHDELATARVTSGLVNPYFHALRRELEAGLVRPPEIFRANDSPDERLKSWALQLLRSNQNNRYAAPEGYRSEIPSMLAQENQSGANNPDPKKPHGSDLQLDSQYAQSIIERGARLREFADGRAGVDLIAVVRIEGDRVSLEQSSHVAAFDDWVLSNAEVSVGALPEKPPQPGAVSVWRFKGKVSYLRSSREIDAKQDLWYLVLMAPFGMAPGTFDEVRGEANYVDLRYPHYEAHVSLLQVY